MVTSRQWNQRAQQLLRSLCCRLNTAPLRNWQFLKKRKIIQTKYSKEIYQNTNSGLYLIVVVMEKLWK